MAGDKERIKEESGYPESSDFGEIEKEMGLGNLLEDENDMESDPGGPSKPSDHKLKHFKKVLFVFFVSAIVLTVLGVSLILGKKIFSIYKTTNQDVLQEEVAGKNEELPNVAMVPKPDEPAEGEGKHSVNASGPDTTVKPVSDQTEKGDQPVMGKYMVQPAPDMADSLARPEITARSFTPAKIASTLKPATKAPKPAAKKKAVVVKTPNRQRKYAVIVGSFSTGANADILKNQLKAHHYKPRVVMTKTPKGKRYRVVAGSYRSLRRAKAEMVELKKLGFQSFFIVQ